MKLAIILLVAGPVSLAAQVSKPGQLSAEEIQQYKQNITDLVTYVEGTLNFLGNPKSPQKEKEIVINKSYLKVFANDKVQVEDDLDEQREVPLHKDVQAYLKDIEFFFRSARFKLHLVSIDHKVSADGLNFFKVTLNRDLAARTVGGDTLNNKMIRYMEVNLDPVKNELKIASMYTTQLNEKEELRHWWKTLPDEWRQVLGGRIMITDSLTLADVLLIEDSLMVFRKSNAPPAANTQAGYDYSLPVERSASRMLGQGDTLYLDTRPLMNILTGIVKLKSLDVSGNQDIRSLEPVSELSDLEQVNCSNTVITSLFPLRNLNKLVELDCSNTPVSDLSPLQYSTSIRRIDCSYTLIDSLKPLEGLVNLESLDFSGLRTTHVSFLAGLPNLTILKIQGTYVDNLEPLKNLTKLTELDISGTRIKQLDPLSNLKNLEILSCENTSVTDLAPLAGLDRLAILKISHTLIGDLTPLENRENLKKIYWDSESAYPEELEEKWKVATEFMKRNQGTLVIFESEELLRGWKELEQPWKELAAGLAPLSPEPTKEELHVMLQAEKVVIGTHPVTTLKPVRRLYKLSYLDASNAKVSDFTPVSEAIELEYLDASGTGITDLKFAANLTKLVTLNVSNTAVGSLEPISKLKAIRFVYADKSGIGKEEANRFVNAHPGCIVVFHSEQLTAWWNGLPDAWKSCFASLFTLDSPPTREQLHILYYSRDLTISDHGQITSLEPLSQLSGLESLVLTGLPVNDLGPLSKLKNLKKLTCSQMPFTLLNPLSGLALIEELNLMNTPVEVIDPLSGLTSLKSLNLSGTQIKSLKPIAFLTGLTSLDLSNTPVKSLKPLEGLTGLKSLQCFNTRISAKAVDQFRVLNPGCNVVYY